MEAKWDEPAVQGIGLLGEAGFGTAVGAGEALRQDLLRLLGEPGVGAFGGEELGDGVDGLIGADGLAAVLAVEHGNGQAPLALAGDAPIVALSDHGLHPVNAPAGHPKTTRQYSTSRESGDAPTASRSPCKHALASTRTTRSLLSTINCNT